MGLMYVFPVGEDETDFVDKKDGSITLKTYGLPYIFWIYAICVVAVIFFMFLAIKAPVLKLIELGDETDATLGYTLLTFVGLMPIFIFGFFFYEKRIIKKGKTLTLQHRVFGIPLFTEKFEVESTDELTIESFIDSPNMAKLNANESNVGFQNKGYFVLYFKSKTGQKILVDRHSRKADLEKLKKLISVA